MNLLGVNGLSDVKNRESAVPDLYALGVNGFSDVKIIGRLRSVGTVSGLQRNSGGNGDDSERMLWTEGIFTEQMRTEIFYRE